MRDAEGKVYVGNGKKSGTLVAISAPTQPPIATSPDLPF
jgi:hypothetical protein